MSSMVCTVMARVTASMSGHPEPHLAQITQVCRGVSTSSTTSLTSTKFCSCSALMLARRSRITLSTRHACAAKPVSVSCPVRSSTSCSVMAPASVPAPMLMKSTSVATGLDPCSISASAVSFFRVSKILPSASAWSFHFATTARRWSSDSAISRAKRCARLNTLSGWPGPCASMPAHGDSSPSLGGPARIEYTPICEHALPSTRKDLKCSVSFSAISLIASRQSSLCSLAPFLSSSCAACATAHASSCRVGSSSSPSESHVDTRLRRPARCSILTVRPFWNSSSIFRRISFSLLCRFRATSLPVGEPGRELCSLCSSSLFFMLHTRSLRSSSDFSLMSLTFSESAPLVLSWHSSRPVWDFCSACFRRLTSSSCLASLSRSSLFSCSRVET
mmetsp:Transcript_1326/g.5386  ORF Transcript_1326/g.5386 Transcript_1326/m.5386 type:complete len:390 (+) Transcript_1326:1200-2369(+)